jgi:predicted secreted protein
MYVDDNPVAMATENGFSGNTSTTETTNKSSNNWEEHLAKKNGGEFSVGAFKKLDDVNMNFWDFFELWATRTPVTIKWSTEATGDKFMSAQCIITAIDETANHHEDVTFSATLKVTGAITTETVI